ncbi:DNA-processing protein DprA [Roseomonas sp. BN140053]|uniref:DNA-processing protein DprA n=1 Tax=Roseomonas sp. BN140053 TaxID=3391898 RepID=UPI0039E84EF6
MTEAELLARLRLARTDGIGPLTFRRLLDRYGSGAAAVAALPGWSAQRNTPFRLPEAGEIAREHDAVRRMGGRFLLWGEPDYPPLLALLEDAPVVLAVLGDPAVLSARQVAVVGARNASAGGRRIAEELAQGLAAAGLTVTSGLARGIDAAAHAGALRAGQTVAALPGGLDVAYPPENARLQDAIAERGALVAEAPLGTAPLARHFPRRNRVVAGLSLGVAVVEAALRSGTLITARLAIEAGREVYAVPGSPLDPRCQGSNDLLRQGAHLCERAADVLETLPDSPHPVPLFRPRPEPARAAPAVPHPSAERDCGGDETSQLLELIGHSPVQVDEVLRRCHLSPATAQAMLLDLELSGRVEMLPGNRIVRSAVPGREGT